MASILSGSSGASSSGAMSGMAKLAGALKLQYLAAFAGGIFAFTSILGLLAAYQQQQEQKASMSSAGGATAIAQEALKLESGLDKNSGNIINTYSFDNARMQDAIGFWRSECGGVICKYAMPPGYFRQDKTHVESCPPSEDGVNGCAGYDGFQCATFVHTVFALAKHPFTAIPAAASYWTELPAQQKGWQQVSAKSLPLPGDIIAEDGGGGGLGHVSIVAEVTRPDGNKKGSVIVAQANGYSNQDIRRPEISPDPIHIERLDLFPDYTLHLEDKSLSIQGYLRNPSLLKHGASANLVRLNQCDRYQYHSQTDYDNYCGVDCSTASMTEVMDAYGKQINGVPLKIGDVAPKQEASGYLAGGIQDKSWLPKTAALFGFKTVWGWTSRDSNEMRNLDDLIDVANAGAPVIIDIPPGANPDYSPGHFMVVTGGDNQNVYLADSSGWDKKSAAREDFVKWWGGFYVVMYPEKQDGMPDGMPNSVWTQVAYQDALYYDLNPTYFLKQINQESGFQRVAVGPPFDDNGIVKHAYGIAQFTSDTAAGEGLTLNGSNSQERPGLQLDAAARHMEKAYTKYRSEPGSDDTQAYMKALNSYNPGPAAVDQAEASAAHDPNPATDWFKYIPDGGKKYVHDIMGPSVGNS